MIRVYRIALIHRIHRIYEFVHSSSKFGIYFDLPTLSLYELLLLELNLFPIIEIRLLPLMSSLAC